MKTSSEIHGEIRECWRRQCIAHGLDPEHGPQRGVFNNMMMLVLELFETARQENEQLRLRVVSAMLYDAKRHEPLPGPGYLIKGARHVAGCGCVECGRTRNVDRSNAFAGKVGG